MRIKLETEREQRRYRVFGIRRHFTFQAFFWLKGEREREREREREVGRDLRSKIDFVASPLSEVQEREEGETLE